MQIITLMIYYVLESSSLAPILWIREKRTKNHLPCLPILWWLPYPFVSHNTNLRTAQNSRYFVLHVPWNSICKFSLAAVKNYHQAYEQLQTPHIYYRIGLVLVALTGFSVQVSHGRSPGVRRAVSPYEALGGICFLGHWGCWQNWVPCFLAAVCHSCSQLPEAAHISRPTAPFFHLQIQEQQAESCSCFKSSCCYFPHIWVFHIPLPLVRTSALHWATPVIQGKIPMLSSMTLIS